MHCEACGFTNDAVQPPDAVERLLETAHDFIRTIESIPVERARERPAPGTWSPLEYACHVRDVLLVQRERVLLARRVEEPIFESMGREERAVHDSYNTHDRAEVVTQVRAATQLLAGTLAELSETDWQRTGVYPWPEPTARTLRWVAAQTIHELIHHRDDIEPQ